MPRAVEQGGTARTADFEDFLEPRPDLPPSLETELKQVVSLLVASKWPFRLHATCNESITRFLDVFEEVNRDVPFKGLSWFFDHCETISDRNLERVKALGGGIAIQHRMAYQGEYFMERYGKQAAERTPLVRKMLELGIPVGAGTDATRVASYNPWVSLNWLTTGKTVGGVAMYPDKNRVSREEALRLYTQGSSWFSSENGKKGAIAVGQLADLVALTDDYFAVPEEQIKGIESVLTVVGGKIVHATEEFTPHTTTTRPSTFSTPLLTFLLTVRATLFAGRHPGLVEMLPRGHGIEEHVERRNLAIVNDNYIQASVLRCLAARAGTPSQATGGIQQSLRLAARGVNEVRMCGTEITGKFVKGFTPDHLAWRHIQLAILGIKLGDCRTASCRITLAEDLLKVAMQQFVDSVTHDIFSCVGFLFLVGLLHLLLTLGSVGGLGGREFACGKK